MSNKSKTIIVLFILLVLSAGGFIWKQMKEDS